MKRRPFKHEKPRNRGHGNNSRLYLAAVFGLWVAGTVSPALAGPDGGLSDAQLKLFQKLKLTPGLTEGLKGGAMKGQGWPNDGGMFYRPRPASPPPPPRLHDVGPQVEGALSAEVVARVVRAHFGLIRACYQKELNRQPTLGGKLVIRFIIDRSGQAASAVRDARSTIAHPGLEGCVLRQVMRLKFPPPVDGGRAIVTYPLVFWPSDR